MIDIPTPAQHSGDEYPFLDTLLRDALPEMKLALGELIDRENSRALPGRYARLLPETTLVITVRPDAAEALAPVAATVERELTDSCTRHGSLYDRSYRVQLRRSEDPDAPLYRVAAHAGHDAGDDAMAAGPDAEHARSGAAEHPATPHGDLPAVEADREGATQAAPLPVSDPDATRIEDVGPPTWQPGRWLLVVEDDEGDQREVFRLTDPFATIGRRSDDPELSTTFALAGAPHVSRRQLAILWQERDGAPGFRVYNLGLNALHLPSLDLPGAHVGRGGLRLEEIPEAHVGWAPPGVPLRIGDSGPTLRIEEVPEPEEPDQIEEMGEPEDADPDATRYE